MVGGGNNAFIGAVHHAAALMDNRIELVCGCFSSHPDISLASGREYFLPDNRIYFSHAEMIEKESALPDGERMDFISIVTPNVTHFEPAMMALDKGFDVVIEKPMTFTLEQASRRHTRPIPPSRRPASASPRGSSAPCARYTSSIRRGGSQRASSSTPGATPHGVPTRSARARRDAWAT